jgi:CRP/FNR family transcriptional regulator
MNSGKMRTMKKASNISCVKCSACPLSNLCYPEGLSLDELKYLDQLCVHQRTVEKNEYLFRRNDALDRLYTIKSGSFKSFTSDLGSNDQILAFFLPGELLGLEGISTGRQVSSVIALEKSFVCEVVFTQLFELSSKIPRLQRRILNLVSKTISTNIDISVNSSAKARICSFLLNLSGRFKLRGLSAVHLLLTMSREDIGNYLGLATETVSRVLNNLQHEALIELSRRNIVLKDL